MKKEARVRMVTKGRRGDKSPRILQQGRQVQEI